MRPLIDLERRRTAWTSYWATGGLHSCIGSLVDSREGAIGLFWRECFAGLQNGARVLDLATGNGAVPKLLLESTDRDVCIDAVDLAELKPQWMVGSRNVSVAFHPNVRMEALPFPDAGFDLVTSQFGLEYAQWPAALDEATRVCGEKASVAFILHHADSIIVRTGGIEHVHQQCLLGEGGLVAAAMNLLPHLARVGAGEAPDAAANRAREAYNEAMRQLAERMEGDDSPDLLLEARQHIHSTVGGRFGAEPAIRHSLLQAYAQALEDASVRTRELLACALDESRANDLVEALRSRLPGRAVERKCLVQSGDVVAWGISAT